MAQTYDVIIIGSGAGGGTLARHLAPSGKRILILERGGWLPRELENWDAPRCSSRTATSPRRRGTTRTARPSSPGVHYWVGGATKFYGAALYRLRKEDFGELKHHDGISPAWPISYDEMEPYYTQAEQMYQVHGARGEDPTEPPASAPYPFPAVSHEPRIQQLHDDLARAGYHPFHAPCGIMLNENEHAVQRLHPLQGLRRLPLPGPRQVGRRGARRAPGAAASERHLADRRPGRQAEHQPAGTAVTEVVVERDGADTKPIRAASSSSRAAPPIRPSCCCMSANDKHPNGLANGSDQVGRNYMFHNSVAVLAVSKEPNPTKFQKTLGLNDFYFGMPGFEYPDGQHPDGRQVARADVQGREADRGRAGPDVHLDEIAKHAVDFWLSTEDLPRPDNRVTVERDGNIKLSYTPTNQVPKQKLYDKLKSMLNHLGMHRAPGPAQPVHEERDRDWRRGAPGGHCRFGTDPKTSVLDTNCKAHELDNLYVVDTSFFPSIGAVNPALTAMANALRVGDHLLERLK